MPYLVLKYFISCGHIVILLKFIYDILSMIVKLYFPFAVGIIISFTNREYIGLLISSSLGLIMIGIAALLMIIGLLWLLKIAKVEY